MELMRELSLAPGVSGSEEEIAKIITRELEDVADKIEKTGKKSKKDESVFSAFCNNVIACLNPDEQAVICEKFLNPEIISVDKHGRVTANDYGTGKVLAYVAGVSYEFTVTVTQNIAYA